MSSFSERLVAPIRTGTSGGAVHDVLLSAVHSLERGQRFVDGVIRRALAGRDFSHQELLAIQAGVYRYTQELELFSRLVEKSVAGIRQTMQTQA